MLLLLNAPRTTDDVDFFWLEKDEAVLQQEIYALRDGIEVVAEKNKLDIDWLNYMTHWLMYDQIILPKGRVWKQFGPLYVHTPSKEFIFALKIVAGRDKDIEDLHILHRETKIRTRQQAQKLLDRYILPKKQEANATEIAKSFKVLFNE